MESKVATLAWNDPFYLKTKWQTKISKFKAKICLLCVSFAVITSLMSRHCVMIQNVDGNNQIRPP